MIRRVAYGNPMSHALDLRAGAGRADSDRRTVIRLGIVLGVAVAAVYLPVSAFDFVALDDPEYVAANGLVQRGLTLAGVRWAFTTFHFANWHPLTWLSYMADCHLFGPDPRALHLVNLLLHVLNTLLLFAVLCRLTGAAWRAALVAALFGLHPLHVESVAWISERKDLLSTLFALLTIAAYQRFTERPTPSRYLTTCVLFALGL